MISISNVKSCFVFLLIISAVSVHGLSQDYPDGTLILSSKKGVIGRIAKNMTGGDQYTHVSIIIDEYVYEQDFPRSKKSRLVGYRYKPRSTNDFYVPTRQYTKQEVDRMRNYAESHLGQRYQLKNYLNPRSRKTSGNWCSPWVGRVLNSSGRYNLSTRDHFEPQNLISKIRNEYTLVSRLTK